ncbi:IS3 family transposase [bacterium]|nr:IS3 family transposase [bacterium]
MENSPSISPHVRTRNHITHSQKLMILKENREDGIPISILARKHGIHPITIYQWKRKMSQDDQELSLEKIKEILLENERLKKENKSLKVKVADLSIDTEILKDALDIVKKKESFKASRIAAEVKELKKYQVTRITKTLGLHRTTLYKKAKPIMKFYQKPQHDLVLSEIKEVLKQRPSYGYKRVTSLINRKRKENGLNPYNKKPILRVMLMYGLVLLKSMKSRDHQSTGKVMTLHSNTRWCSDCFEIKCFNGEKVFVAFVLDTHDRELVGYVGKSKPIQKKDIQALMLLTVEKRFTETKAPREIQFLTDRGSIYGSKETIQLARSLGLKSCFTMAYTLEINGMAEARVMSCTFAHKNNEPR